MNEPCARLFCNHIGAPGGVNHRENGSRSAGNVYLAVLGPQFAKLPGRLSRSSGHLQDGTLDAGPRGLNISTIKNQLVSTVEQFIHVIVPTALILG